MNSIRWRLIAGILAAFSVLLGTGGSIAYLRIRDRLYRDFDHELAQRALALSSWIELEWGVVEVGWLEDGEDPPGSRAGSEYFCLWDQTSGRVLAASPELGDHGLPRVVGTLEQPSFRRAPLPGGRKGRCAGIAFLPKTDPEQEIIATQHPELVAEYLRKEKENPSPARPVQLVVARVDSVSPVLHDIRLWLCGLWAGGVLLGCLTVWFVVRQSLRPLDQLSAQIGRLDDTVAGQRVYLPVQPTELRPVTTELNRLLDRVENALSRERNLTSNVAHELRTPIAGMLAHLEFALSRERQAADYRESAEECFEIAKRLHWLVNNLLSITRIEAGNVQLCRQILHLQPSLAEWWIPFESRARERRLSVDWDIDSSAQLVTDPEFLRVVVSNLFDNAVSYTPPGGAIRIRAGIDGLLFVANQTIDLDAAVVDRVFEPFWRSSESRREEGTHTGLGLSLCRKIIELLGGKISASVEVQPKPLFVVRVEMAV